MKYSKLFAIMAIVLSLNACNKEDVQDFESIGTIQGTDLTMSPCSGGYVIDLEEDEGQYRIESLPEGSVIDLQHSTFPIAIRLNWTLDRTCASFNYIIIDDLELVD